MAYIKSRKHSARVHPLAHSFVHPAAIGLMAVALPVAAAAQQATAPDAPKPMVEAPLVAQAQVPAAAASQPAAVAAPAASAPQAAPVASQQEVTLPPVRSRAAAPVSDYKADNASSPKFTQPLVDTPQTITVIKKELFQQQGATSLSEALRNTPGVTMQLGENGNTSTGDSIFMRGFDTSASIFVDGIRDLGSISRDTFNIDAVEVIKGPSGSDNGRGASSGYVNMVSKVAEREAFNNGSISAGDANRVRVTADLNRPLDLSIPGSALRLNVVAQDYGTPGRDSVRNRRFGFAPSLAFGLGTPTRVYFNYLFVEQRNRPDGGVSTWGLPGYIGATGPKVDPRNYYGSLNDYDNVRLHMFTSRIEHDLGRGTMLRNITRLGSTEQSLLVTGINGVDAGTLTVQRSRQGRHQTNNILTNQTNLSTEIEAGPVKHSLSTGVEFIYESQNQQTPQTITDVTRVGTTLPTSPLAQPRADLYNPSLGDAFLTPPYKGAYSKGSTLSAAFYAFDTMKVNESLLFNGGVRVEKFHTETNGSTFTAASNTGVTPATAESLAQNPQLGLTDLLVSWKLGALVKPTADSSVYATISNSYQPPGGANFSLSTTTTNQANPSVKPQEGSNIEIGTKWDLLAGKLSATAAVYRSENKNELISDGATPPTFASIGKRRVQGIELGLVGQVTPELNVSAGLAYMDPKIIQGVAGGANANNGGVIVYSPRKTFSSWAAYKLPAGWSIAGGVRYVDPVVRSSNLVVTSNLPGIQSYWVADAMLGYDVSKNVNIQFNLYNLFDKDYAALVNNGGSRYIPGQPRNALLTANLKF